jgi:hypothetical protein
MVRRVGVPAAIFSALLGLVAVFQPIPFGLALRAWMVAMGGLVAAELVRAAIAPFPRLQVRPLLFGRPRRQASERPAGLEEVERAVDFAVWSAVDLSRRLRPLLREVAVHRLKARRGVDLDRDPKAAQLALGDDLWAQVGAGDLELADRRGPGVTTAALREAVELLERL